MVNLVAYPYPTYVPNKVAAGCVAAFVGVSLVAWFIQSCQTRFRPPRLSFLLLTSHLMIFSEMIVRATVDVDKQYSKYVFIIASALFAVGQRMIIIGNFVLLMRIYHEKSCLSRSILTGTVVCVITSGCLTAPANTLSFESDHIQTSFLFRELSASILLAVTLLFYPVWYWSKTVKDMTIQAIALVTISSVLCVIVATFNLIQSFSAYYSTINSHEGWFYGFQMAPIVLAHFTWSILHPKRSLASSPSATPGTCDETSMT
jgi:hypothetical protein